MPPEQLNLFMENISNVLISKVSTKKDKNLPIDEVIKLLETCAKIGKNIKQ